MKNLSVRFKQIAAVQVTDVVKNYLIDILYGIDESGQVWRNVAGKGWELHMEEVVKA